MTGSVTRVARPDGTELAVRTGGPEGAPGLLLLPGQANSMHWWDELRTRFEDDFATAAFDYRGTGDTTGEVGAWTTRSFADDAAAVMSACGHERFAVYATSMGGRVAQHLAAAHPERVSAMVLACTSPGGPHARERGPEVRRALGDPDREARLRATARFFFTDAWLAEHDPAASPLLASPRMSPAARRAHLRASDGHDAWDLLPGITAPTLVMHGTDDAMSPTINARLLADRIPHARLLLCEGGRHGFFDEFADELHPDVMATLAS